MVEVSDLKSWESEHGRIPDGAVVVMYSGWGERFSGDTKAYVGASKQEIKAAGLTFGSLLHNPGFGGEAARWLIENR